MNEPHPGAIVTVLNLSGRKLKFDLIRRAIVETCRANGLKGEVGVLLTTDEHIRELNSSFRQVDEATDVLTFAASADAPSPTGIRFLGEIAISVDMAARQAASRKTSTRQEVGYLALHGALHLAGWDDEEEQDRAAMVAEMNRLAPACGLVPDPDWHSRHYSF